MYGSFCFFDTFTGYAWFGTITQENNIILEKKNNSPLYIIYNNRLILIIDIIIIQIQTRKEILEKINQLTNSSTLPRKQTIRFFT